MTYYYKDYKFIFKQIYNVIFPNILINPFRTSSFFTRKDFSFLMRSFSKGLMRMAL